MKKSFAFALLVLFSVMMNAQTVTGVNIVNYQAKSTDSNPKMFVVPMVASMEIVKDATTTFTTKGTIKIPSNSNSRNDADYMAYVDRTVKNRIEELKSQALFEFSEKAGADLILSPMFSVTTDSSNGLVVNVTVKVKGYPAKYTKFREMTENDSRLVTTAAMIDEKMDKQVLNSKSLTNNETVIRQ